MYRFTIREPLRGRRESTTVPAAKETALHKRLLLPSIATVLALGASAGASEEQFVVRVRYAAPTGCPTEDAYLRQVLRRARLIRLAAGSEPAREFRAVITKEANTYQARLEFIDPDLHRVSREIEGSTCDEVTSALVLITALAIDPLLSEPTHQSDTREAPAASGPESMSSSVVPGSTIPEGKSNVPRQVEPKTSQAWVPALGMTLGAVSDAAPDWAPNIALLTEFTPPGRSAAVRLELSYTESTTAPVNAAGARFRLMAAALHGCPWVGNVTGRLRIWPCAAFEAGEFHARGRTSPSLPFPNTTNAWWLAGDADLRAELDLSRYLAFEVGGKMRVPIIRNTFVYERPLIQAYTTPALGAAIYIGINVRLSARKPGLSSASSLSGF